ncbi:LexA family transcriptional regulator [Lactococcus lactis]|uniref:XRE family transcriptional regulator n=1 Tax=Lactococcus lactis subsp. lactis bv. diacetylactis TaxID=44688 RepID=A0A8B3EZW3_LACLL|nr:XRE family transcriptional regulator [Lactococcus lactis]KST43060.1 repressor [Lactococcus lactis subsp. lactis bv. diacetylactis]MCT3141842.1 XRE family transcriptional regulator [Lactococcus lactis]QNT19546.1 helix-turn-helix domain-containing protein [Lactococcus lactis subsp. lactis bv. diacetylactis]RKO32455.1 XRE family transcriptional regulator [Lactococcus lactis subsp. lactis bv. diacetylactis]
MEEEELERRKIVAENIRKLIKEKGITQKQLAKEIGMSQNIITEYVKLRSFPPGGVLQKIADYFGVKKSDIDTTWKKDVNSDNTPIIEKTIDTMKQLEEPRQKIVLETATNQLDEQIKKKRLSFFSNKVDFDKISNIVPYDPNKEGYAPVIGEIAAGTPILSEQNFEGMRPVYGKYAGRDDIFWLRVKGESMETEIHDGSFALILQDPDLSEGSIGAVRFIDDNEATLKCVFYEYDENGYPLCLRLEPLNPDYPIQYADEYNPAVIEGRLVKVEQDY